MTCAPGHTSYLCSQCAPGWYASFGNCYSCSTGTRVGAALGFCLLFLVLNLYIWKQTKESTRTASAKGTNSILIFWFQLYSLHKNVLHQLSVSNESSFSNGMGSIIATLAGLSPVGLDCLVDMTYEFSAYFTLLLPIWILLWAGILYLFYRGKETTHQLRTHLPLFTLLAFTFFFMNISNQVFELWNCRTYLLSPNLSLLEHKPFVRCDTNSYQGLLAISILIFCIFILGGAIGIAFLNRSESWKHLHIHSIATKDKQWYWETYLLLRKVLFTFLSSVLSTSHITIIALCVCLMTCLIIQMAWLPYQHPFNNGLEVIILLHVFFYFTGSFITQSTFPGIDMTQTGQTFVTIIESSTFLILAAVLVFKYRLRSSSQTSDVEMVSISKV
jgi:hypothetical protein